MINMFFIISFFIVFFSISFSFKDALSLLMILEILILSLLHFFSLIMKTSTLFMFSISFIFMTMAVLAACMALSMLSGYKKINSNLMNSNMF